MQRRRHAGGLHSHALLLACAALALPAPAAGQVGLADDPRAESVALSGADVLVARTGRHGSVAVDTIPRGGGGARRVFALLSPGRDGIAEAAVAASPQRVALLVSLEPPDAPPEWRLYTGPPSGPLSLELRSVAASRRVWLPVDHAVDGEQVLVHELRFEGRRSRVRVMVPGSAPALVPWPGRVLGPATIAGGFTAFVGSEQAGRDAAVRDLLVADWRTGAVAYTVDVGDPDDVRGPDVDLLADGTVVVANAGRLVTAAPGQPQRAIPHAGRLSGPRFAGAAGIAALRRGRFGSDRPVVLEPAGGAARALGGRSVALESFAADPGGAAWLANGCVRYAPLDGSPPSAAPDPCPAVELFLEDHDPVVRGRTVRILVTCVAAPGRCRGTALLGTRGRFGRGRFDVPAGTRRHVDVRLTRRGLRYVVRGLRRQRERALGGVALRLGARVRDGRVPAGYRGKVAVLTRRMSPDAAMRSIRRHSWPQRRRAGRTTHLPVALLELPATSVAVAAIL